MRFFSGGRDSSKKKGTASQLFRANMNKKDGPTPTADEKYKKMIEDRIVKLQQEYLMGNKKGGFTLPGTKKTEKKELSKRAKEMIVQLARKKEQADRKKANKKQAVWEREQRSKQKAELYRKQQEESTRLLQEQAALQPTTSDGWW